jgi:hypothetical protein
MELDRMADFDPIRRLATETYWSLSDVIVWIVRRDENEIVNERTQQRLRETQAPPGASEAVRQAHTSAQMTPPLLVCREGHEAFELLRSQCEDGAIAYTARRGLFSERKSFPFPAWRDLAVGLMTTRMPGAPIRITLEDADTRFGVDAPHESALRDFAFRIADVRRAFPPRETAQIDSPDAPSATADAPAQAIDDPPVEAPSVAAEPQPSAEEPDEEAYTSPLTKVELIASLLGEDYPTGRPPGLNVLEMEKEFRLRHPKITLAGNLDSERPSRTFEKALARRGWTRWT